MQSTSGVIIGFYRFVIRGRNWAEKVFRKQGEMNLSRTLFGMSPPHIQPLTPVSEVSEPPESPSPYPYLDGILEAREQVNTKPDLLT